MVNYIRKENLGNIAYVNSFVEVFFPKEFKSDSNLKIKNNTKSAFCLGAPFTITINITNKCNFSCKFCYFEKGSKTLTYNQIDLLIDYIKKNYIYEVDILGGEPLLPAVKKKTKYLINYLLKIPSLKKIYISTNGYFLDKSYYSYLNNDKIELSISLEGPKKIHDFLTGHKAYDKVIKNVTELDKNTEIKYTITTVINKKNYLELKNFYLIVLSHLSNLKCWLWHYPTITKYNGKFDAKTIDLKLFFDLVKIYKKALPILIMIDAPYNYFFSNSKIPTTKLEKVLCICKAKYKKIEIMPDGSVFPCVLLRQEKFKLGNLETGFKYNPDKINLAHNCNNKNCKYQVICYGCLGYKIFNGCDDRCPGYQ